MKYFDVFPDNIPTNRQQLIAIWQTDWCTMLLWPMDCSCAFWC